MSNRRIRLLLPGLVLIIALAIVGISSASSKHDNVGKAAKAGGSVTYLAADDVDFVDPGQTYYTFGYILAYSTNRPLYSFSPINNYATPRPDLATGPPKLSNGNKTITVHLRKGIFYSPPLETREVTAADVKYAIERAFTANVSNGYASSFFADIKGAPATYGKYKKIPGLVTKGKYTLIINLKRATGVKVAAALVMPITIPVPQSYAKKFDNKSPSTYDGHVVFTGPYMVKNNASGELTGRQPGKSIQIVRNPSWKKGTDFRPAYLDSITIKLGNSDLTLAGQRTLSGSHLLCCDAGQPPATVLNAVKKKPSQYKIVASGGTRWVALNTKLAPFNNINVRKAVTASFNRNALVLTRGGKSIGPVAKGYIPPGMPGFKQSGGLGGFQDLDFLKYPAGNMQLAKKYMLKARAQGVKNINAEGRYTGPAIVMIGSDASPAKETAAVAQAQFAKLGFKGNLRTVSQTTLYTDLCGKPATMSKSKIAACLNVGWFKDFNDAEPMLLPTFDGGAIKANNNVNWSLLNVPKINKLMKQAQLYTGTKRNNAWADINHRVSAQAPAIPYIWDNSYQIASSDVNTTTVVGGKTRSALNGYTTVWDLAFISVK